MPYTRTCQNLHGWRLGRSAHGRPAHTSVVVRSPAKGDLSLNVRKWSILTPKMYIYAYARFSDRLVLYWNTVSWKFFFQYLCAARIKGYLRPSDVWNGVSSGDAGENRSRANGHFFRIRLSRNLGQSCKNTNMCHDVRTDQCHVWYLM